MLTSNAAPDFRGLLRIGGTATIPKTSSAMVVLVLSMDLVDRDYSIRAMTNRAALSNGSRICKRMGRSGRGDMATDA